MKLYLAGPMTGYADHNFPAFHKEAAALRSIGHEVINPAELNLHVDKSLPQEKLWLECMRGDIHELIECDAIALMEGWEKSSGATLEYDLAVRLGLRVYHSKALYEAA